MVTKAEFKKLKKEYCNENYRGKTIITFDENHGMIMLIPYNSYWWCNSSNETRHQLVGFDDEGNYYYLGVNGDSIKGFETSDRFTVDNTVIVDDEIKEFFSFWTSKYYRSNYSFYSFHRNFYDSQFRKLLDELKAANIPIAGMGSHRFKFAVDFTKQPGNLIYNAYGVSPKNLRTILGFNDKVKEVFRIEEDRIVKSYLLIKKVLSISAEEALDYILVLERSYGLYGQLFGYGQLDVETRKALKQKLLYYHSLCLENPRLISTYEDYCHLRESIDPAILDKKYSQYPKDTEKIEVYHNELIDISNREYNRRKLAAAAEKQSKYNEKPYEEAKAFEFSDSQYSVIACKELTELVTEGNALCHCVGSYVDSVSSGKEYILFLRKNDTLDVPFFTIDVTPAKVVRQIHGYRNCNLDTVDKSVQAFVQTWADKFHLDVANCDGIKSALH